MCVCVCGVLLGLAFATVVFDVREAKSEPKSGRHAGTCADSRHVAGDKKVANPPRSMHAVCKSVLNFAKSTRSLIRGCRPGFDSIKSCRPGFDSITMKAAAGPALGFD